MRARMLVIAGLVLVSAAVPSRAGDRAESAERRRAFVERYDADGDGRLSGAERDAAREAVRAAFVARHDTDGDGALSDAERDAARAAIRGKVRTRRAALRQELRSRADTNGDGTVDQAERGAARERAREMLRRRVDTDHDGSISGEELQRLCHHVRARMRVQRRAFLRGFRRGAASARPR